MSIHDECWQTFFAQHGGVDFVLQKLRTSKIGQIELDGSILANCGARDSYSGKTKFSDTGLVGPTTAANVNALKTFLPSHLEAEEVVEVRVRDERNQGLGIKVIFKSLPSEIRTKRPPMEPSLGVMHAQDLGKFYVLISSFEGEIRNFTKKRLGKGWIKRLEHELPAIVNKWREREITDTRWGIDPEKELINYADLTDYMQIIRKYDRIFAENGEELSAVITKLKDFANYGRNPLMHCRTLDHKKYWTTQSAVDYLREWIKRRT